MSFDRHPYLKHSTAMPFKPAVKAMEQPAGQVVNEDKGLSSLSEYIRSINRDDVAAEGKLTFDEWLEDSQVGYQTVETKADLHFYLKEAWNAALKHGKVS